VDYHKSTANVIMPVKEYNRIDTHAHVFSHCTIIESIDGTIMNPGCKIDSYDGDMGSAARM